MIRVIIIDPEKHTVEEADVDEALVGVTDVLGCGEADCFNFFKYGPHAAEVVWHTVDEGYTLLPAFWFDGEVVHGKALLAGCVNDDPLSTAVDLDWVRERVGWSS